ncbi:MAG: Ni/Fe hydrogenase subunit alpha [Actinobacteria bacterium]|nr:Ni/Fe hydrogenase subunit alpha [Actinomycetota bacterium]MCL6094362.1 Ni/Fe hydrogenase subunit alpha [Actinomycetota bacterium]
MTHNHHEERVFSIDGLARVEGEGSLHLRLRNDHVEQVSLEIFEPPRFFEAFLRGRDFTEVPDITARICGICPVAYQLSSTAAMESACGVEVSQQVAAARRLLYCGEWLQSHALHVYLLHAPDFFGVDDAVQLARLDREAVERGLRIKRTGNLIMETIGGRAVHPVNVAVGGFHRSPTRSEVISLAEPLRRALDDALDTVDWVSSFDFPELEREYLFVALRGNGSYPMESGNVALGEGLQVTARDFEALVIEEQVEYSTALHARLKGAAGDGSYLTGPLARFALNADLLTPLARQAAHSAGMGATTAEALSRCNNPFRSIIVRAIEMVFACEEGLRLVESYEPPDPPAVTVEPRAGTGVGITEAPRGLLLHRYDIDERGIIQMARIVPPTSQNQSTIESDLVAVAQEGIQLSDEELGWRLEQAVRNHDPCISCSAHFLNVTLERG